MAEGEVTLDILDGGGAVAGPNNSVQVKVGCATSGTAARIVATRSPKTLQQAFTSGPLPEAAALSVAKGGTVLAMRAATVTPGSLSGVVQVGTGTSVVTASGTPVDDSYIRFRVTKDGTIGTPGIRFRISLDAGRHEGPELALGAATSFAIAGTGVTLAFAAGNLKAGDTAKLYTVAPQWDIGGLLACIDALKVSQFAVEGWGSFHVIGPISGADAATLNAALEDLAVSSHLYLRLMVELRDADPPAAWGGAGEDEQDWIDDLAADVANLSARRIMVSAGHYNVPSPFPNVHGGSPSYRRPGLWAVAARRVLIPPQRHDGRVRDGSLDNITVSADDAADGFIYHDEFFVAGLTEARICAYRTRRGRPGFFVKQPKLASPVGSVFTLLPLGNVMDIACGIVHAVGENEINDDIDLNPNGTVTEEFARSFEATARGNLKADMIDTKEIVNAIVVVDRAKNVAATSEVDAAVTIFARGYVLSETITIGFADPFATSGG